MSFLAPTAHIPSGALAVVWVCIAGNGAIASAQLLESSGDSRFDALAVTWAQRVRLRALPVGALRASCGAVRVEVHKPPQTTPLGGRDTALG